MPLIRTWQDATKLDLTPAEVKLVEACQAGTECLLNDFGLPPEGQPTPENRIRAELLRFLITGGCETSPVADQGVRLVGAHVTGTLDLSFAHAKGATRLAYCRFDEQIAALDARLMFLNLKGSALKGLDAQGAEVKGTLILSKLTSSRTIRLPGARIGGQIQASGATFNGKIAGLILDGCHVAGAVNLNGITATALVRATGARIGGQLNFQGAKLLATQGDALNLQGIRVTEGLYLRDITTNDGTFDLASARVGDLIDDTESWPPREKLYLNGFQYGRLAGGASDLAARLEWAADGSYWQGEFYPQPFTELARAYRDNGHDSDAATVLATRERLLRLEDRKRRRAEFPRIGALLNPVHYLWDVLLRGLVGYGHHPFRSVAVLLALMILAIAPAHFAWEEGSMAPSAAPILVSDSWQTLATTSENPAAAWSTTVPGKDWESFNRYAYAADLVIPIIAFGQTDAWAPSTERGPWGYHLWWMRWLFSLMGWITTALGAAAITGLIRRD